MTDGIEKYSGIIDLPHHTSANHLRMPMLSRAAQFSPFAALTGYEGVIEEVSRTTSERIELGEEARKTLDERFALAVSRISECPEMKVTVFRNDETKEGGRYITLSGRLVKFDEFSRTITLEGGTVIPVSDIFSIDLPEM